MVCRAEIYEAWDGYRVYCSFDDFINAYYFGRLSVSLEESFRNEGELVAVYPRLPSETEKRELHLKPLAVVIENFGASLAISVERKLRELIREKRRKQRQIYEALTSIYYSNMINKTKQ